MLRFFAELWKGQPLVSMEVILNLIGNSTSRTGLKFYAMEDDNKYPTKRKIDDQEMKEVNIVHNNTLGKWNYTIRTFVNILLADTS